jgi:hypothetical protein
LFWLSIFGVTSSHERIPSNRELLFTNFAWRRFAQPELEVFLHYFPRPQMFRIALLFPWWSGTTLEPKSHVVS